MTRLSHRWLLAAPIAGTLATLTALPAAARDNALPAQRIVIDADTGRPRMPEHDELARAAAPAARSSAAKSAAAEHPTKALLADHPAVKRLALTKPAAAFAGAQGKQIGLERLSFTVVRRDADGKLSSQCVTGDAAAGNALRGVALGEAHDH